MANYRVQNPATGEIVETFEPATDTQVTEILQRSEAAFLEWRKKSVQERAAAIKRAAQLFAERRQELAETITLEMGKSIPEALDEVDFATDIIDYYAVHGPSLITEGEIPSTVAGKAVIQRLPIGPLLGVMPWNFPYYQVARFAAPNLLLGNTVIVKHADICARSAQLMEDIFLEAGVIAGGYHNIYASHDQIAKIIADPITQGVSLTGSERAGAIIAEQAGKHLKKCVLELGGNDPMIVLADVDVAEVAKAAWDFRTYNLGQVCNSNKRIIVEDAIYDAFVAELVKHAANLRPGDPHDLKPGEYGPMSSRAAAETVAEQIDRAVAAGARVLSGGELAEGPAAYYSPTVLVDVPRDSAIFHEEIFGPVVTVYRAADAGDALALANDSAYGLGGSVFSRDVALATELAQQLNVGMAHVNTIAAEAAELPFGGVKRSGFGREMGPIGIDEFVNKRLFFVAP